MTQSKTEDLGAQALDYGETYDFSFRANQDTCYWCKLYRWKKENGDSALYKTLIDAWGSRDCGDAPSGPNQFWGIREDGAYTDNVLKKSWLRPEDANDF
uniref:Uncharacterized protein n=1 Tax=Acrobeloides nanus TaxID=290746 RepID=A0A914EKM9_9BILA